MSELIPAALNLSISRPLIIDQSPDTRAVSGIDSRTEARSFDAIGDDIWLIAAVGQVFEEGLNSLDCATS